MQSSTSFKSLSARAYTVGYFANKAGVTGEALKKVKACHKLSIISYVGAMLTAGLGAWAGNKIRDEICKLKTKPSIAQSENA